MVKRGEQDMVQSLGAAAIFLGALFAQSRHVDEGPTDADVSRTLQEAFKSDHRLNLFTIQVSTTSGSVTLKGKVDHLLDRHQAESIARRVAGVRSVANLIEVETAARPDEQIADDVRRRLRQSTYVSPIGIEVHVTDGVVTLSGEVPDWAQFRQAEIASREVEGVKSVRSDIVTNDRTRQGASIRADEQIRADVQRELARDAQLTDIPIRVSVEHGIVQLEGEVPYLFHREHAAEETRLVNGVRAVDNRIVVVSQQPLAELVAPPTAEQLRAALLDELKADPRVTASQVDVAVTDNRVSLVGVVASMFEREVAERIARSVFGVTRVDNQLTVNALHRSDEKIRSDVVFNLKSDSWLGGQALTVTVREGIVTVSGETDDFNSKLRATRLAARVNGVRSIVNEAKVRWNETTSDDGVRRSLEQRLLSNAITRPIASRVTVVVKDGHVALAGTVDRSIEVTETERLAQLTDGVRSVRNELLVNR